MIFTVALSACGGGKGGSVQLTELTDEVVTLGSFTKTKIVEGSATIDGLVKLTLDESNSVEGSLSEGKTLVILPGDLERYPLGLSGTIKAIEKKSNTSSIVTLSPASLTDVVKQSNTGFSEIPLNGDNFLGVISPEAVHASSSAANKVSIRKINNNGKIALGGGIVVRTSNNTQNKSFLGENGSFEGGNIELGLEIKLDEFVDNPNNIEDSQSQAATVRSKVVSVSGKLTNLKLVENHEFKNNKLESLDFRVEGDLRAEVKISGNFKLDLGYYSKAWNEVKEKQFEFLGQSAKFSGLDGRDKIGKYPVAGLVFATTCPNGVCPTFPGQTQTPIRKAKTGGVIVWVFINAKGELTLEGSVGLRTNMGVTLGVKKPTNGKLVNISTVRNPSSGRAIEAPFIDGKAKMESKVGFSLDADFFVLGVRPVNASLALLGKVSGSLESTSLVSYGMTKFGDDWSVESGDLCFNASVGGGVIASVDVNIGAEIETSLKKIQGKLQYTLQVPTDDEIQNVGWHGLLGHSWYTGASYTSCFPSIQPPILNATAGDAQATLEWNTKVDRKYDVCLAKEHIVDPIRCSGELDSVRYLTDVSPELLVNELDNEELYYFVVIAKRDSDQTKTASNEATARPQGEAVVVEPSEVSINVPQNIFVNGGEVKTVPFTFSDPDDRRTLTTCLAEQGVRVNIINRNYKFTAPTLPDNTDSLQFKVTCTIFYDEDKSVSGETLVTVTKTAVENQPPEVFLPANGSIPNGSSYLVTPSSVIDEDKPSLTYTWSAVWSGDRQSEGSTDATTGQNFTLHVPQLEPGESGSVLVILTVSDGEFTNTDLVTYTYTLAKTKVLSFEGYDFVDGATLERGSTKLLTWTVKNAGNVPLTNVKLALSSQTADKLNVTSLSPSTIASWPKDEIRTFTVEVSVPKTVLEGRHKQRWDITIEDGNRINYTSGASAYLDFEFVTTKPNELIGRLIPDKTLLKPGENVTALLEVTNGNAPYLVTVNWGDGSGDQVYPNLPQNTEEGMTQSYAHTFANTGTYPLKVTVIDNAEKQAIFRYSIEVSSQAISEWEVDVHDLNTDERAVNIDFSVSQQTQINNVSYGQYSTNWQPTIDPESKEYFVKYRLPVPSGLLKLDKKMRFTTVVTASGISAYDREINLKTSDSKEYTASVRHQSFEETLSNGQVIKGGYFTTKDLVTGQIVKEAAPFLQDQATGASAFAMAADPAIGKLAVYSVNSGNFAEIFSKNISLSGNSITELDITFKGNGKVGATVLEYDMNGDGVFGSDEKLLLNTESKSVDWSVLGGAQQPVFNDAALLKCINRNALSNINTSYIPTQAELDSITNLDCFMEGIRDISALSSLKNLVELRLFGNLISNIDALADLINLETLSIRRNQITNIDALSGLLNLRVLKFDENQVTNVGVLSGLISLEAIELTDNYVTNIGDLSSLTDLYYLDLSDNCITDFSRLQLLPQFSSSSAGRIEGVDSQKDISECSAANNLAWTPEMSNNKTYYFAGSCNGSPETQKIIINSDGTGSYEPVVGTLDSGDFTHHIGADGYLYTKEADDSSFDYSILKEQTSKYLLIEASPRNGAEMSRLYFTASDANAFANSAEAANFEICGGGEITISGMVSGNVVFKDDNNATVSVPSNTYIRIVPKVFGDADRWDKSIRCKVSSSGSFGSECYTSAGESEIRGAFTSSETYQIVLFKNHINPAVHHWELGETSYSSDQSGWVPHGAWSNVVGIVSSGNTSDPDTGDTGTVPEIVSLSFFNNTVTAVFSMDMSTSNPTVNYAPNIIGSLYWKDKRTFVVELNEPSVLSLMLFRATKFISEEGVPLAHDEGITTPDCGTQAFQPVDDRCGTSSSEGNGQPPEIRFYASTIIVKKGEKVVQRITVQDVDGDIGRLEIDWGDGVNEQIAVTSASTEAHIESFSHIYTDSGEFELSVIAVDKVGNTSNAYGFSILVED